MPEDEVERAAQQNPIMANSPQLESALIQQARAFESQVGNINTNYTGQQNGIDELIVRAMDLRFDPSKRPKSNLYGEGYNDAVEDLIDLLHQHRVAPRPDLEKLIESANYLQNKDGVMREDDYLRYDEHLNAVCNFVRATQPASKEGE